MQSPGYGSRSIRREMTPAPRSGAWLGSKFFGVDVALNPFRVQLGVTHFTCCLCAIRGGLLLRAVERGAVAPLLGHGSGEVYAVQTFQ